MQAAGAKDFQVGLAADPRSRFVLEIDATLESSIGGWFRDVNGVMRARLPALALMLPPTSEPTVRITKQKVWSLLKEVV
jgi:hypothetical protein